MHQKLREIKESVSKDLERNYGQDFNLRIVEGLDQKPINPVWCIDYKGEERFEIHSHLLKINYKVYSFELVYAIVNRIKEIDRIFEDLKS